MTAKNSAKKTKCHLKHQKGLEDKGELIEGENEFGFRFSFRRHCCVFCGNHMEDEIIKEK